MHFLGIMWDNERKTPWLKHKQMPHSRDEQYTRIKSGESIAIKVQEYRYCIGSLSDPDYKRVPCKLQLQSNPQYSQCQTCKSLDSVYILPVNSLRADQSAILKSQPHINYINIFGGGIIKTGVAAKVRKITRLLEQGAIASLLISETDGITSRVIETNISRIMQIKQAVLWESKIKNILDIPSYEKCNIEMVNIYRQLISQINDKHKAVFYREPVFLYNIDNYGISFPENLSEITHINQLAIGDSISGVVSSVYGEIIFIRNKDKFYALNTKYLQGYMIDFVKETKEMNLHNKQKIIQIQNPYNLHPSLF
jgi:hypothetical protein